MSPARPTTVDAYIAAFPDALRPILEAVRKTIRTVAPDAEEGMSYGIATYRLGGHPLVYFGGWKTYVSVYPLPAPPVLADEMAPFRHGAGTVRFRFDRPIPHELVSRIVQARRAEMSAKG